MSHTHTHECETCKQIGSDYRYQVKLNGELEELNAELLEALTCALIAGTKRHVKLSRRRRADDTSKGER